MKKKTRSIPQRYRAGFLDGMDKRHYLAKELNKAYREVADDLGGLDSLSVIQRGLIERYVWLGAIMRGFENQFAELDGKDTEALSALLGRWTQSCNSFIGLSKSLGLERRSRKTVDLQTYVQSKSRNRSKPQ